jgi:hypothetical protein
VLYDIFANGIAERLSGITVCPEVDAAKHSSIHYFREGGGKAPKAAHFSG